MKKVRNGILVCNFFTENSTGLDGKIKTAVNIVFSQSNS